MMRHIMTTPCIRGNITYLSWMFFEVYPSSNPSRRMGLAYGIRETPNLQIRGNIANACKSNTAFKPLNRHYNILVLQQGSSFDKGNLYYLLHIIFILYSFNSKHQPLRENGGLIWLCWPSPEWKTKNWKVGPEGNDREPYKLGKQG